ncbi:unnamed protein product, partial [marine sediment metagenome]
NHMDTALQIKTKPHCFPAEQGVDESGDGKGKESQYN